MYTAQHRPRSRITALRRRCPVPQLRMVPDESVIIAMMTDFVRTTRSSGTRTSASEPGVMRDRGGCAVYHCTDSGEGCSGDRVRPADPARAQPAHPGRDGAVGGDHRRRDAAGELFSAPALAARFNVSATPVREAMLNLEKRGFVEAVRNKGFRVTGGQRGRPDRHRRRPAAARTAGHARAGRRGIRQDDPRRCGRWPSGSWPAPTPATWPGYLRADTEFHLALTALLGNRRLVQVVADLRAQTRLVGLAGLLGTEVLHAVLGRSTWNCWRPSNAATARRGAARCTGTSSTSSGGGPAATSRRLTLQTADGRRRPSTGVDAHPRSLPTD